MKIGILTFYESYNYGTVLQAYALQRYLENSGNAVEHIRIERDFAANSNRYKAVSIKYSFIKKCHIKICNFIYRRTEKVKREAFNKFRENHILCSERIYKTEEDFQNLYSDYDAFVSGGDQIWNPYHKVFSLKYMFDMLPDSAKRISYASSFGIDSIEDENIREAMKKQLEKYAAIAVREESGLNILNTMGLSGQQVLDPVFLLGKNEWKELASKTHLKKKYCVVYALVEYAFSDDNYIFSYAKKNKLDVIILPINRRNQSTFYEKCYTASPEEFLSLVEGAECVFTNSFHGAAFSIIFEKQFYLLNNISKEAQSKEGRLGSMLNMFGISSRRMGEVSGVIEYDKVNSKLNKMKESSKEYLDGNL